MEPKLFDVRADRDNLNSIVVEYLKEAILSGSYNEGDRIVETEVADHLGVSRAPIREAIRELEKEGIVETKPRRGSFVTKYSLEDIKEIFDIRLLLENNINKILIDEDRLGDIDYFNLTNMVREMEAVAGDETISDHEKYLRMNRYDMDFHRYIWRKSDSKRRVKMLETIFFQLRIAMIFDMQKTGDFFISATDHYAIIDALRSNNIEQCKVALQEHIISYKEGTF